MVDPDDFEGDLSYEDKAAIGWLVDSRREPDNVAPLERWAARLVQQDTVLRDQGYHERRAHFAALLPKDTIGRHASSHLDWSSTRPTAGCTAGPGTGGRSRSPTRY